MSWPLWCDVRPTPARPLPATPNLLLYISAVTLLYLSIKSFLQSCHWSVERAGNNVEVERVMVENAWRLLGLIAWWVVVGHENHLMGDENVVEYIDSGPVSLTDSQGQYLSVKNETA